MSVFVFRLEAALRQRVRQEQGAQVALAHALGVHAAAVATLTEMEAALARLRSTESGTRVGAALDVEGRLATLYYLDRAEHDIERQRQHLENQAREVERLRAVLVQASHRRRALERLRERQEAEFHVQTRRLLEGALDELVTVRYGSGTAEEEPAYAS